MSFEKMMEELRRDYVASIPQKMKDIEAHLAAADVGTLRDDFHKLKGTGKTYGIPEISELGEAVEKICKHKPEQAGAIVPGALTLLREIHTARLGGQPYVLVGNSIFAPILAMAAAVVK
jgi:HPt (histidine-containing phosphotransfer) domain-containing protein